MGNGLRHLLLWVVGGGRACRRDTTVSRTARPPLLSLSEAGQRVEIRIINGKRCTNLHGAAEYLNRSLVAVRGYASPKNRAETHWPEPEGDKQDRQYWYPIDGLDTFAAEYLKPKEQAGRPRAGQVEYAPDPEALIDDTGFRALIDVERGTWARYVHDSQPSWDQGKDGYLPKPDHVEPVKGGTRRYWKQHRAADWHNHERHGTAIQPRRDP